MSEAKTLPPLTLFAEASPASLTVSRAKGKAARTKETCGMSSPESLANLGPDGWWQRTSPDSEAQPTLFTIEERVDSSSEFCETLPKWQSGQLSQLAPLERFIDESESSLWPTPTTPNGGRSPKLGTVSPTGLTLDGRKRQVDLKYATQMVWSGMWTTPSASDATRGGRITESMSGTSLAQQVKTPHLWPTPTSSDHKGAQRLDACKKWKTRGTNLPEAALKAVYATPQARDYRTGQAARWDNPARSRNLNDQMGGKLSVIFVEWLMGFPFGWTDLPDSVMQSYRNRRKSSAKRLRTPKDTSNASE